MRINYEDPEVVARQNIAPNAGCDIDGVFYDMRNCVHLLKEQADRIEELEAKLSKAVNETLDAASAYIRTQYGISALSHPVDRGRILAEMKGEDRG